MEIDITREEEMSTSLVVAHTELATKKKTSKAWKNRGTYGLVLKRKLEFLMELFMIEAGKKRLNFDRITNLSRTIDFNISIQLSNIRATEEIKALKDLEKWKNELISKLGDQGNLQTVSITWKY